MNILVVAPHPDDESIGCGGTIRLHADRGDRVAVAFLTSGERGLQSLPREKAWRVREREAEKAAAILGVSSVTFLRQPDGHLMDHSEAVTDLLTRILKDEQPQLIYATHESDRHPDHRAAARIVSAASRASEIPSPALRRYEVLTFLGEYDRLEDISLVMAHKLKAVRAHRSQMRQFPYDRAVRGLNEYRGAIAEACRYAEVFDSGDRFHAVPRERTADPSWYRICELVRAIERLVPAEDAFILVDDGNLRAESSLSPRRCIPFLEKDGRYWGKPADDEDAIGEVERQRVAGAAFMVFTWPAMWWLDYYAGLRRYLESGYRCLESAKDFAAFDLRERS